MATLTDQGRVCVARLTGETLKAAQGAMVAYEGNIDFKYSGTGGGQGFKAALKQRLAGESIKLMDCTGTGTVYLAQDAKQTTVIDLNSDTISVESDAILAVTDNLTLNVKFAGLQGLTTGQGLATTIITGNGQVALLSNGPLIGLDVTPQTPVVVDPNAYIASIGTMSMSLVTGITWKTFLGEGNGEPFSLRFEGTGTVFIQPTER